ncbi:hypothetical protein M9Y10_014238 [Tritrichomonas musculus]|uniref:Uncharacterized protein n=1 Tax=Tritrichomonas musculus TaxID=1915356 RepID=A0ABR2KZ06_9EUKA
MSSQSSRYIPPSKKFALSLPVNPLLQSKLKSQDLRQQLQSRIVDLGSLQTEWSSQESQLRTKSEDLITQLRALSRQYEIKRNEERAKHLQALNQIIRQHQNIVLDLQSQINECIEDSQIDDDCSDIDQQIKSIKIEINGLREFQAQIAQENRKGGNEEEEEEVNEKVEMLQNRLNEMQNLYTNNVLKREEESKSATLQLEGLILKQQDIDQQNQLEIQQLVDEINNIDLDQATQIAEIKKKEKDIKRSISQQLKEAMNEAAQLQHEIFQFQHDHKKEMNEKIDIESQLKQELAILNSRHAGYLNESINAAKKCSEEVRRMAAMKREIEELNSELLREKIENTNLIKESNKIDDDILNQVSENHTTSFSLSFSYNRF